LPENDNFVLNSNCKISNADRFTFVRFNLRFKEFWVNWDDLRTNGINMSGNIELKDDGRIHGGCELGVDRFRLKGFFMIIATFRVKNSLLSLGVFVI